MKVQRAKIINPAAMQFHPIQQVNQNDNCKLTQSGYVSRRWRAGLDASSS
jgi:hypothetical protein